MLSPARTTSGTPNPCKAVAYVASLATRSARSMPARLRPAPCSAAGATAAYGAYFHATTSFVLVPAYIALCVTGGAGCVGQLWTVNEPSNAPLVGGRPRGATRAWITSALIPVTLGGALLLLLCLDDAARNAFARASSSGWMSKISSAEWMPSLQGILAKPAATIQIWIQIVLLDFIQARYVWQDAKRAGVPWRHSIILCFVVGPLGLISHAITKWTSNNVGRLVRQRKQQRTGGW